MVLQGLQSGKLMPFADLVTLLRGSKRQGRCQENEIFVREQIDVLVYGGEGNANSMRVKGVPATSNAFQILLKMLL